MYTKSEIVAAAEQTDIGGERPFSPAVINRVFEDLHDLAGRPYETPEDAFLGSLLGDYTSRMDERKYAIVVTCHSKGLRYVEPER